MKLAWPRAFLSLSVRMNFVIEAIALTQDILFLNPYCMEQIKLFFAVGRNIRFCEIFLNTLLKELSRLIIR